MTDVPVPPTTIPTLGCPGEYEAIITLRDCETYAARVGWSDIAYSRVLDDISDATVKIPDYVYGELCNVQLGSSLVPWKYGLRIERDGGLVWTGPITSISRPPQANPGDGYITVAGKDKMAWLTKRVTSQNYYFRAADVGVAFYTMVNDAVAADNEFGLNCPLTATGDIFTRDIRLLNFEPVYDILADMAKDSVDFTVVGAELVTETKVEYEQAIPGWFAVRDGVRERYAATPDPYGRYMLGLFTNEAWAVRPGYTIDGLEQGNNVYIAGADTGEAGFRRYWQAVDAASTAEYGLLAWVEVDPLYQAIDGSVISSEQAFVGRAASTLALRADPPVVLNGGQLSEQAPVTFEYLIPGSVWAIDLAEAGISWLTTAQRLSRVDVSVTRSPGGGLVESVSPTLIPLGSDLGN